MHVGSSLPASRLEARCQASRPCYDSIAQAKLTTEVLILRGAPLHPTKIMLKGSEPAKATEVEHLLAREQELQNLRNEL
jgi:hypothetical protein